MLNTVRKAASGFAAKLLLLLLILSFGVWGVGDMLREHGAHPELGSVGGRDISRQAYAQAYHNAQDRARQMLGAHYSPELLRGMGLPQQILRQLISEMLLQREAESLGLLPPDTAIAREIRADASFHNDKGAFDKAILDAVLQRNNLSLQNYIDALKRQKAVDLLTQSLTARLPENKDMLTALHAALHERREARLITLSATAEGVHAPEKAELEAYYQAHAQEFMTPEYRSFYYATITPEELMQGVDAPEEELRQAYEARAKYFGDKAEPFETLRPDLEHDWKLEHGEKQLAALSTRLEDLLAGGSTLPEAAKELHMQSSYIRHVTQAGVGIDGKTIDIPPYTDFMDTAFKLEDHTESPLRRDKNGTYYIIQIEHITPPQLPDFASMRDKAEQSWKRFKEAEQLGKRAQALAQSLQASKDIEAEIARQHLQPLATGPLARNATRTASHQPLSPELVQELFTLPIGGVTHAHAVGDVYQIALLQRRIPAPAGEKGEKEEQQALEGALRQEVMESYIAYLRTKYPVVINEQMLTEIVDSRAE